MFYHFLYPLNQDFSFFNIFRYITFRSFLAFIITFILVVVVGRYFIIFMKKKQFGQVIRDDGPASHLKKAGTPTFGGIFIFGGIFATLLLCGNFLSWPFCATLLITSSYFILGFYDDYLKILKNNSKGVRAYIKLLWQFFWSGLIIFILIHQNIIDTFIYLPFIKEGIWNLGYFYIPFGSLVVVGSSNAVNLTDGLDGLAIGVVITCAASLMALSYAAGHLEMATYLYIPYIENVGELVVLAAGIIGAGCGFLWFNSFPAQIFMGDVGSLPLGGALGMMAVLTKNEFLFIIFGGIFVVEALSVIIQVLWFKMTGRRVFKMAPIHHHFELSGWSEPKVIIRFWIISIVLAIISIATLKIR